MKRLSLITTAVLVLVGAFALTGLAAAETHPYCEQNRGDKNNGRTVTITVQPNGLADNLPFHAGLIDWKAQKTLGLMVKENGGSMRAKWCYSFDPRWPAESLPDLKGRAVATSRVADAFTYQQSAGRLTGQYNGNAPTVLRGHRTGVNDRWVLRTPDGAGGGLYALRDPGTSSRSRGDTLTFTRQMLIDRDRNGTCTVSAQFCRNYRYDAQQTVAVDPVDEVTVTRNITSQRLVCPPALDGVLIFANGATVEIISPRKDCNVKRTTRAVSTTVRQVGGNETAGPRFIPN